MKVNNKKILIGAGVLVIGYLAYKKFKGTLNSTIVPKPLSAEEQEALSEENENKKIATEDAKQAIIDAEDRASILAGRG